MDLDKFCRTCSIALTTDNASKKNAKYYRNECKKCRSRSVIKQSVGNPKRQAYARAYIRRKGIVKEYPCITCSKLCYKKYAKAFCSDACRFMSYVKKEDDCWLWTGYKDAKGYGKTNCGSKLKIASRFSYELFKGPISDGMFICHTCDVPSCVNPDHLWAGSHVENMMDMVEKGRQRAKLTSLDVFNIRKLWEMGKTQKEILSKFNIKNGTLSNIIARRIWKHV